MCKLVMCKFRNGNVECMCTELKNNVDQFKNATSFYLMCPFSDKSDYTTSLAKTICKYFIPNKIRIYKIRVIGTNIIIQEFSTENSDCAYDDALDYIKTTIPNTVEIIETC
jgi:hypothetical protein